jgi:hypothetical protein
MHLENSKYFEDDIVLELVSILEVSVENKFSKIRALLKKYKKESCDKILKKLIAVYQTLNHEEVTEEIDDLNLQFPFLKYVFDYSLIRYNQIFQETSRIGLSHFLKEFYKVFMADVTLYRDLFIEMDSIKTKILKTFQITKVPITILEVLEDQKEQILVS